MPIETWRQAAYELLPTFRDRVDDAEDVGMLWIDLQDEVERVDNEPLTEEAISSLFRYAS